MNKLMTMCTAILFIVTLHGTAEEELKKVDLSIGINPGQEYTHTKWFVVIPMNLTPQMAFWVEDSRGRFVSSLFITEKAAEGSWKGGGDVTRPEALPVYFHRYESAKSIDTLSGATPKQKDAKSREWSRTLHIKPGEYRLMGEVNSSFDYNAAFQKQEGNVNGQPSLIYAAEFKVAPSGSAWPTSLTLQPIGHGDPQGKNGNIVYTTEGLTTALELVDKVHASLK